MKVYVKVFATLVRQVSGPILDRYPDGVRSAVPLAVDLPDGSAITGLIAALGLPGEEVKVVFVNGRSQPFDHRLSPGDQVGIFPAVGGG